MAPALAKEIGRPVAFADDCVGDVAVAAVAKMAVGDVLLLENLRFHKGEEKNDKAFEGLTIYPVERIEEAMQVVRGLD